METKSIVRELRCILTEKEIIQAAKDSADLTRTIGTLEDDKARSNKDYAARIAEKEAARSVLNEAITSGFVLRQIQCTVALSTPKPGMKRVTRNDTKEVIAEEAMTADELQRELELDGEFVFDKDGACDKPAEIVLKCPLSWTALQFAKAPGEDGRWFYGFRFKEQISELKTKSILLCKDGCKTPKDAADNALSEVFEAFSNLPAEKYGKKAKAAIEWIKVHADTVKEKSVELKAGKGVVVE